jgi:hypothetical protein
VGGTTLHTNPTRPQLEVGKKIERRSSKREREKERERERERERNK